MKKITNYCRNDTSARDLSERIGSGTRYYINELHTSMPASFRGLRKFCCESMQSCRIDNEKYDSTTRRTKTTKGSFLLYF